MAGDENEVESVGPEVGKGEDGRLGELEDAEGGVGVGGEDGGAEEGAADGDPFGVADEEESVGVLVAVELGQEDVGVGAEDGEVGRVPLRPHRRRVVVSPARCPVCEA